MASALRILVPVKRVIDYAVSYGYGCLVFRCRCGTICGIPPSPPMHCGRYAYEEEKILMSID